MDEVNYIEKVDSVVKEKFSECLPNSLEGSIDIGLESPNFIYKDRSIEVLVTSMKYRDNSRHDMYPNFLGMSAILIVIPYNKFWGNELDEYVSKRMKVAVEVILSLARNNVFMEEMSRCTLQVL